MAESGWARWIRRAVITALAVFTLVPLYVMVSSSVKPLRDVQGPFTAVPSTITLQPFVDMWRTVPLARYFVNSAVIALGAMVCSMVIAILAAYAVSRFRFRGRGTFLTSALATQMFPGILFLLPLFLIFVNLDRGFGLELFGSRVGMVITYLTFALPFSIWLLAGYFDAIPRELDEAALVDGTGPLGALFRVLLPAALPGVAAVAVYSFMTAWTEVLFASVLTTSETRTLAVGLRAYATQSNVYWNQVMAASLVVSVPVLLGFLLLQRALVQGLTAGAVKS
ncbi:carbohydrate ABC transporter permease [Goodfellowiella coeruleoviolacea]|uniref:Carbohydrate ABC transporter membrane protein 2, CUT1 family (TC 3.A.1.1.-) n=1 Tax=Goodfellowiella coeruleoviolacea TaxID=334858 RepID=A0AAE3GJL6_9PSEU|nr:carbohydrate ABC transporter permease [Goodfellowiella coeruleoviolacea]MCP2169421.1 carbohydrate ABC transporter membrane protein 2, CUT1 family (TC 3.A.1.1.-) [Goodfellowiella coeruleoviolacea]